MAITSYLRRLKVRIPDSIKNQFGGNEFLRFGIVYEKSDEYGFYVGKIMIRLVPKHGGTFCDFFPLLRELSLTTENPAEYALEAKRIARDSSRLTSLLTKN